MSLSDFILEGGQHHGGSHDSAHNRSANWCCCNDVPNDCCDGDILGVDLFAEIIEDNDCTCITGQVVVMAYAGVVDGSTQWQGRMWMCDSGDASARNWADIVLKAGEGPLACDPSTLVLEITFDAGTGCTDVSDLSGGSCDPFLYTTASLPEDGCCNDGDATPNSFYHVKITDVDPR